MHHHHHLQQQHHLQQYSKDKKDHLTPAPHHPGSIGPVIPSHLHNGSGVAGSVPYPFYTGAGGHPYSGGGAGASGGVGGSIGVGGGGATHHHHHPYFITLTTILELMMNDKSISKVEGKRYSALIRQQLDSWDKPSSKSDRYDEDDKPLRKKRKGPATAYEIFCEEKREELKRIEPDILENDIASRLRVWWREITDDEAQRYIRLAEESKMPLGVPSSSSMGGHVSNINNPAEHYAGYAQQPYSYPADYAQQYSQTAGSTGYGAAQNAWAHYYSGQSSSAGGGTVSSTGYEKRY